MEIVEQLHELLAQIAILPRRIGLATPGIMATVPMLRGTWGAALHGLDAGVYTRVFEGEGAAHERTPSYILRPATPVPGEMTAVEWILVQPRPDEEPALLRAWDIASGMGLGSERRRFHLRSVRCISADGGVSPLPDHVKPWTLDQAGWPLAGEPGSTPCRISFSAPLRIMFRKSLVFTPTFVDIAVNALRRLVPFLPVPLAGPMMTLRKQLPEIARGIPSLPWSGERLDLHRYSARQNRELELRGVWGYLDLPEGPGPLWPLLAACRWIHLGKGTIVGLGQLEIGTPNQQENPETK